MTLHRFYCFIDERAKKYHLHIYRRFLGQRLKKKTALGLPSLEDNFKKCKDFLKMR